MKAQLLASISMVLLFAACSSKKDDPTPEEKGPLAGLVKSEQSTIDTAYYEYNSDRTLAKATTHYLQINSKEVLTIKNTNGKATEIWLSYLDGNTESPGILMNRYTYAGDKLQKIYVLLREGYVTYDSLAYDANGKLEKVFKYDGPIETAQKLVTTIIPTWTNGNLTKLVRQHERDGRQFETIEEFTFDDKPNWEAAGISITKLTNGFTPYPFNANNIVNEAFTMSNKIVGASTTAYEYNNKKQVTKFTFNYLVPNDPDTMFCNIEYYQ